MGDSINIRDDNYIEFCQHITDDEINEVLQTLNKYIINEDGNLSVKDEYKAENLEKNDRYWFMEDDFLDSLYDFVEYRCPTVVTREKVMEIRSEENVTELINQALYRRHLNRKRHEKISRRRAKENQEAIEHPALKYMVIREQGITVSRDIDNLNENTFDFVTVEIFKGNYSVEFITDHKDEIVEAALYRISQSRKFTKYGVPVNILKVDRIRIIGSDMVLYFSVREV